MNSKNLGADMRRSILPVLAVALLVMTGCASSQADVNAESSQLATTSVPARTTPSATPSLNLRQTRIADLEAMSFDRFREISREDVLLYAWHVLQDPPSETATFLNADRQEEGALFEFNPVDIAAESNDGQQILNQHLFVLQSALAQRSGDGTTANVDRDEAKKLLDAAFYYAGDEPTVSNEYISKYEYIDGMDQIILMVDRYFVTDTSELQVGKDKQGNEIRYKDISYTTNKGASYVGRFVLTSFENEDLATTQFWQLGVTAMPEDVYQLDENL